MEKGKGEGKGKFTLGQSFIMRFCIILAFASSLVLSNPVPAAEGEDPFLHLSDDSFLHAALHAKKEYKHGVFARDRHALQALHREEAVKIVQYAELLRRQDNSSIPVTTTRETQVGPTTTVDDVQTETNDDGNGPQPTPTPVKTSFTTTRLTTIMENGQSKTITATEVVVVTLPNGQETLRTTATTTGAPGLQTNEAGMLRVDWVPVGMAVAAGVGRWFFWV